MRHKDTLAYGLWPSPITPLSLSRGIRLSEVARDEETRTTVWLEGRSDRGVLVTSADDDAVPRDLTDELSVRATLGYGGGDFTVGRGALFFISGGRIYRQGLNGGAARAITPVMGAPASPKLSPDGRWLLFVVSSERVDSLGVVDSRGEAWPVQLHGGRDFYMQPAWSPDGRTIAWVAWDHPNMPWDGCELWLADFDASGSAPQIRNARPLAGASATAVLQPEFSPDGRNIAYVSDESGTGQIYLQPLDGGPAQQLTPGDADYGKPAWNQGRRLFAFAGDDTIACIAGRQGFDTVRLVDISTGTVRDVQAAAPCTAIEFLNASPHGARLLFVGSAAQRSTRVIEVDLLSGRARTLARATGETIVAEELAPVEPFSWTSFDGETAHGLFYAPVSPRFESPGLPPLIVLVHGGPTSQAPAGYSAQAQFFATRGYGVLVVNYRGSTGYGRDYMNKLRASWGVYDVEDCRTGCLALAEQGRVDPRRRVIIGGSAGGYTVLKSLVDHPGFYTAGISMYGVSNLFTLASDTHKFEERYLDSLIGPLPQDAALYRERSPIFHADRIRDPLAVFQGDADQVVPKAQSDEIVASLRARGVPHEYHVYQGEGHGWRRSDTVEQFYTAVDRFLRQYVVFA